MFGNDNEREREKKKKCHPIPIRVFGNNYTIDGNTKQRRYRTENKIIKKKHSREREIISA